MQLGKQVTKDQAALCVLIRSNLIIRCFGHLKVANAELCVYHDTTCATKWREGVCANAHWLICARDVSGGGGVRTGHNHSLRGLGEVEESF